MKTHAGRKFRTILCPVDFSDSSRAGLRYAAAIARRFDGLVIVLFVNDPLLVAAAAAAYDERALVTTTIKELHRFVERTIGRTLMPRTACLVAIGNPVREIQRTARRLDCDLLVMGTRGLAGVGRLFVGSTTDRVLRRATIPVLAVPSTGRRPHTKGPSLSWPKRVLAAIELNDRAPVDARAAAAVARGFGARLLVVTVVPSVQAPFWLTVDLNDAERARLDEARARLRKLANAVRCRPSAESRLLVGDPAEQIAAVSSDASVGLTVMTLRPGEGLLGGRQGSTTYRVLCRATVPVLAVPVGLHVHPAAR
jgi:universal stress protein A